MSRLLACLLSRDARSLAVGMLVLAFGATVAAVALTRDQDVAVDGPRTKGMGACTPLD